jgi:hypothetical protein
VLTGRIVGPMTVAACLLWSAFAGVASPASADTTGVGAALTVSAAGARGTFTIPNYTLVDPIADVGSAVSQAVLSTNGETSAFAGLPYPGEAVGNYGQVCGLVLHTSCPGLPIYVRADAGDGPQSSSVDGAGYSLTASVSPRNADATAARTTAAAPAAELSSTARAAVQPNGSFLVKGEALSRGVRLADGLLVIGEASTTMEMTGGPQGTNAPKVHCEVIGATVAGVPVTFDRTGIHAAGNGADSGLLTDAANEALAGAGITIRTFVTARLPHGFAVSALEVDLQQQTPLPGSAPAVTMLRLGSVLVSGRVIPGDVVQPTVSGPVTERPGPTQTPAILSPGGGDTPIGSTTQGSGPTLATPPAATGVRVLAARLPSPALDLGWFYLVIILGGGAGATASWVWRKRGVQATWTS